MSKIEPEANLLLSDQVTARSLSSDEVKNLVPLSDAAKRALAEAEVRRAQLDSSAANLPKEINGRGGLDPARFGDWEVKGVAIDF